MIQMQTDADSEFQLSDQDDEDVAGLSDDECGQASVVHDASVLVSRDKSMGWRKVPFADVKGRRSKVNVVRSNRTIITRNSHIEKPSDAIGLFLDDGIFDMLLKHTNEEAKRRREKKVQVTIITYEVSTLRN